MDSAVPVHDPDEPQAYLAALDYLFMLKSLGYTEGTGNRKGCYCKFFDIQWSGGVTGTIQITAAPDPEHEPFVKVGVAFTEHAYSADGMKVILGNGKVEAVDVLDTVRAIEAAAEETYNSADRLRQLIRVKFPALQTEALVEVKPILQEAHEETPSAAAAEHPEDAPSADYISSTFDLGAYLAANGWKVIDRPPRCTICTKAFKLPITYDMGRLKATQLLLTITSRDEHESAGDELAVSLVDDTGAGFPIRPIRWLARKPYHWNEDVPIRWNQSSAIRTFVAKLDQALDRIVWPANSSAYLLAAARIADELRALCLSINRKIDEIEPPRN